MYNIFECMLLKVPLLDIQIFRFFREDMSILYACSMYKVISINDINNIVYVEMQAHIGFHLPLARHELKRHIEKFVSSHYTIPPQLF